LLAGRRLEPDLAERIVQAAGGNPLYLEELLAMLDLSGRRDLVIPPTIRALLAARLDQLDEAERSVLDRASVEGYLFHADAIVALAPSPAPIGPELASLVRQELLRPDISRGSGGEAYRFRHQLLRDAAYDALPKATRADLHERLTGWLAEQEVVDDEVCAYH